MVAARKAQKSVSKDNNTAKSSARQKVLLPTLKEQQRYVVYKILPAKADSAKVSILSKDFLNTHNYILSQCASNLGIFDGAKAGLSSVKFNPQKLSGILRVDSKYVDKLKVCFGLIKNINGVDLIVDCAYVSGMVNKAVERMDG